MNRRTFPVVKIFPDCSGGLMGFGTVALRDVACFFVFLWASRCATASTTPQHTKTQMLLMHFVYVFIATRLCAYILWNYYEPFNDLEMFLGFQNNVERNQTHGYDTYTKNSIQSPDSWISLKRKLPTIGHCWPHRFCFANYEHKVYESRALQV